jgi:hypothetical protein
MSLLLSHLERSGVVKQKVVLALLVVAASLAACANNPRGDTSRENSSPSVYETNSGRTGNTHFPSGSRNSGN